MKYALCFLVMFVGCRVPVHAQTKDSPEVTALKAQLAAKDKEADDQRIDSAYLAMLSANKDVTIAQDAANTASSTLGQLLLEIKRKRGIPDDYQYNIGTHQFSPPPKPVGPDGTPAPAAKEQVKPSESKPK